jgi:ankyrin repeat protein
VNEGDENQETALHKAVTRGNEQIIQALVDAGADPRQVNKWGQSATDIAAKFRPELVSILHSYQ